MAWTWGNRNRLQTKMKIKWNNSTMILKKGLDYTKNTRVIITMELGTGKFQVVISHSRYVHKKDTDWHNSVISLK